MSSTGKDAAFSGAIPQVYETHLVPMLFAPYAADLVQRVVALSPARVLEIAAGTGVVTRGLATQLPASASLVATDLNQAMIDEAPQLDARCQVEWKQADAMRLPFPDESFDAVVCQFGVMFFPDKAKACAEVRRVLKPGGAFVFNVWDGLKDNEFAETIATAVEGAFPVNPPRFLSRTPYAYHDTAAINRDLAGGAFTKAAQATTVPGRSHAPSASITALAFCHGTPLRMELEAHGASALATGTKAAADALAARFGTGEVEAKMQAIVFTVVK